MASGLLAIYSLSISSSGEEMNNFQKQLIFLVVGLGVFLFFSLIDYRLWRSYAYFLYGLGVTSLILVLWFGVTIRGTSGWFDLGFFNFQPVEVMKVFLIFALAAYLSKFKNKKINWRGVLGSFLLMITPFLLVLKQPDFGSASVLAVIWVVMLFLAGVDKKIIIFLLITGVAFFVVGWGTFFQDYQKERIQTFLNPEEDPLGKGYNVIQSMVAIGSGGLTGKGIGHGSQSQLNFLPEKHTDFVFAAVGEESGFLGAFLVLLSFWVLFFRIIKISIEARDYFGRLLAVGVLALFSYQVLVNVGMNLGIVPVAGISLPFLSYGGSFLFVSFALLGLVVNIWKKRKTNRGLFNEPDLI